MDQLTNLKTILHSSRANIFYLEKCRVMQKDGRVLYLTEAKNKNHYWNIPIANTTVILLGTGTSITQAAVRMLVSAGVLIGFSGEGGTPLLAASGIEWLSPQNEYRPTEYVQGWLSFWFDNAKRLQAARSLQQSRINFLMNVWEKDKDFHAEGLNLNNSEIMSALDNYNKNITNAVTVSKLLQIEAQLTKQLYKIAASLTSHKKFTRQHDGIDIANGFLNHGNYLAYGLASCALWVLGIPHGFAVMHGKTRRGALVFDVADLVKDALVLPLAFICAKERASRQAFRQQCLQYFTKYKALDFMFETIKNMALNHQWSSDSV